MISVKPSPVANQGNESMACQNDRFVSAQFPIAFLVRWSYQLIPLRIAGLPDWTTDWNTGYDIEAKASRPVSQDECRQLVRELLKDRFKIASHFETRNLKGYSLVTTDDGKKLRELTKARGGTGVRMNRQAVGELSMARLAQLLGSHPRVGMPVIDKTALDGTFSFDLTFSMKDDDDLPSVLTALREIGLKLEAGTLPLEVLVVDHIEKASAN